MAVDTNLRINPLYGGDGLGDRDPRGMASDIERVSMKIRTTINVTDEMKQKVIRFIEINRSITNRQCRLLLGLGYEQVIRLFNKMVESGELLREGKTSSVKYRMGTELLIDKE